MRGWRRLRPAVAVLTLVTTPVGLSGCDHIVDPKLPADAEQFTPPPVYSTWWKMTQACSSLSGSLGAVTWYKTDQIVHDVHTGDVIAGYWTAASNSIVLTGSVMLDGEIVRHEMLHALVRKAGHPRDQFLGKCAGTVSCEDACVADAGAFPTPPETPVHVGRDSIEITIDVEPNTPVRAVDEGRFSITILTRNLSSHWVTVTPEATALSENQTFSIDVHGANGATGRSELANDPSQKIFAPHEIKRHVFDLVIGDYPFTNQLLPGDYIVRGGFAGWWSADMPFVIGS